MKCGEREKHLPKCFAQGNPCRDIGGQNIISENSKNKTDAEEDNDAFCVELYEQYQKNSEREEFVSLEEAAELLGIDLNTLQEK